MEGVKTGIRFSKETGRHLIHVMDREADIVAVMNKCIGDDQYFIIRARHDHSSQMLSEKDKTDTPELFRIYQLSPALPNPFTITRTLRNEKGKEYRATCEMNSCSVKLRDIDKEINCVWIKEQVADDGHAPAEWFLLTNCAIKHEKDAEQIPEIYSKRWTVEDCHKCYKTGCSIEKRQFDSRKALTASIGLLAISAVVLLRSRYIAKHQHDTPFEIIVTDKAEQELARRLADKYLMPIDRQLCEPHSALWWLLLLGRMGDTRDLKVKACPDGRPFGKDTPFFSL
ncbi:transposase [Mucilaginibacter sp.]|uniref:transposase n=1 Tax=Mucilaginibacter sp. TaxID=1882438 RepID=UPI002ECFCEC1